MTTLSIGNLARYIDSEELEVKQSLFFGEYVSNKEIYSKIMEESKIDTKNALKLPFSMMEEGISKSWFFSVYAALVYLILAIEIGMNSEYSYSLFVTPWGWIMDSMGMQATIFHGSEVLGIIIFGAVFVSYVTYMSQHYCPLLVSHLIASGKIKDYISEDNKNLLKLNDPNLLTYGQGIIRATGYTVGVVIGYGGSF